MTYSATKGGEQTIETGANPQTVRVASSAGDPGHAQGSGVKTMGMLLIFPKASQRILGSGNKRKHNCCIPKKRLEGNRGVVIQKYLRFGCLPFHGSGPYSPAIASLSAWKQTWAILDSISFSIVERLGIDTFSNICGEQSEKQTTCIAWGYNFFSNRRVNFFNSPANPSAYDVSASLRIVLNFLSITSCVAFFFCGFGTLLFSIFLFTPCPLCASFSSGIFTEAGVNLSVEELLLE
mmetsp:Transcript_20292/g.30370  ORF Transcript_20292/g.30370 Transcript_20292/m.30370 type:complete len:236 (-) Transcript_20292:615-1322(-)